MAGRTDRLRVDPPRTDGGPAGHDVSAAGRDHKGWIGKLLYPFILVCGGLQAIGAALNAELRHALTNPWLATDISFVPVAGLVGAFAVFTGLLFIDKVDAGVFNGLLITANLITAIVLDHFGWLGMKRAPTAKLRLSSIALTIVGSLVITMAKTN